jgi:hypothetical protein
LAVLRMEWVAHCAGSNGCPGCCGIRPLIIACEVVEHFTDPRMEFSQDVAEQDYLYLRGHTSYYSPKAIAEIARRSGVLFDFRLPTFGLSFPGMRKRYVLFTRSVAELQNVAEHFGDHPYAPAET